MDYKISSNFKSFSKTKRLEELSCSIEYCNLCPRMRKRIKVLSKYNGNVSSSVLFIAEAPGRLGADRTGIPLHGDRTGENFEKLLSNIGWEREEIFITNAILCNPRDEKGNNSTPKAQELTNCSPYLKMTIDLIEPQVIITLGAVALKALSYIVPHKFYLKNVGERMEWNNRILIPLYHPSPRAMIHRSMTKQRGDFISISNFVNPIDGIKKKARFKKKETEVKPTTLRQIIIIITQLLGQVSFFKLTKLLYFIDLHFLRKYGTTLTGKIYLRQQEGPWIPDLKEDIKAMKGYEVTSYFKRRKPYIGPGPSPRYKVNLENKHIIIITKVINKYGKLTNSSIKTRVYMTEPMKYILRQEKKGRKMKNVSVLYKDKTIIELDRDLE